MGPLYQTAGGCGQNATERPIISWQIGLNKIILATEPDQSTA
jgi:hypothetical protein